jgi:hypothetical protein
MTANENSRCPSCSLKLTRSREQFAIVLTQARAGAFNPWRDMMRLEKPV